VYILCDVAANPAKNNYESFELMMIYNMQGQIQTILKRRVMSPYKRIVASSDHVWKKYKDKK